MIRSSFNMALRKQHHFYLFAKRARFFMVTIKSRPKNLFPPVSLSLKKRVLPEPHPNWSPSSIDIDIDIAVVFTNKRACWLIQIQDEDRMCNAFGSLYLLVSSPLCYITCYIMLCYITCYVMLYSMLCLCLCCYINMLCYLCNMLYYITCSVYLMLYNMLCYVI